MAGQQQNGGIIAGINVTPLVDVTLVLLIIFIVTAKMVVNPAVPLDLPHAAHGEDVQTVFSLILAADGTLLVDGDRVEEDARLLALARVALSRDAETRAVINADGAVPHRRVIHTLDILRGAGITRVAFGAVPEASPNTGADTPDPRGAAP
jgi:biopolymer transport protein ExbD